jgi:hypothetical protein
MRTLHRPRGTRQARLARAKRPPLREMAPEELHAWIQDTRARLTRKMARERTYLDRRAARGTYTLTDEAYEEDLQLETDLLAMLDEMEQVLSLLSGEEGRLP